MKLFFSKTKTPETEEPVIPKVKYRFRSRKLFCAADELSFLYVLEKAAGGAIRVFSKVHASHLLIPRSELSIESWNLSYEKVVSKQFDYVLCSASDMTILCVVMRVTEKGIRNPGHRFILRACHSVGLPVINIAIERDYTADQIRRLLKKHIPDAFPKPQFHEVNSIIQERHKKLKSVKQSADDNLKTMLLKEVGRRAEELKQSEAVKEKS